MRRPAVLGAAAITALLAAAPVAAQTTPGMSTLNTPSALRCSSLADLEEAERPFAILYLAGYNDGERDALNFATVGATGGQSPPSEGVEGSDDGAVLTEQDGDTGEVAEGGDPGRDEGFASEAVTSGGPPIAMLPTVPVEEILAACAQSPDSRIVDIITAQGALSGG